MAETPIDCACVAGATPVALSVDVTRVEALLAQLLESLRQTCAFTHCA